MSNHQKVVIDNQTVIVGKLLGSGGEGAVFEISDFPDQVLKIYHNQPDTKKSLKLQTMVAIGKQKPNLKNYAAWPISNVFSADKKKHIGFTMPLISGSHSIQSAYNPTQRFLKFSRYGWDFQIRVARNLCAAFDELHNTGCLVGDVNQSNAMVDQAAFVKFVDCDSFQIPFNPVPFLCEVGVPHYTPPELQDQNFRGVVRNVNHDCFGLAVLVYQLIFVGRHPYAGVYEGKDDLSPQEFIKKYLFANGPNCFKKKIRPPAYMPKFKDIPSELGMLFCRAFEEGSQKYARPKAKEWIEPLKKFEKEIIECKRDVGHRYWRHAGGCVWCEIQKHNGPNYYFGVDPKNPIKEITQEDLEKVKEAIASWDWDQLNYSRKRVVEKIEFKQEFSEKLDAIFDGYEDYNTQKKILKIVLYFCLSTSLFFLFFKVWLVVFPGFLGFLIFSLLYYFVGKYSNIGSIESKLISEKEEAEDELKQKEQEWVNILKINRRGCKKILQSIDSMIDKVLTLEERAEEKIRNKTILLREEALTRHLKMHSIIDAEIPSIGLLRKSILVRNNIKTAFDINEQSVLAIKGFDKGLFENLCNWKNSILSKFYFKPQEGLSIAEKHQIKREISKQQNDIFSEILIAKKKIFETYSKTKKELGLIENELKPLVQKYYAACDIVQKLPGRFN